MSKDGQSQIVQYHCAVCNDEVKLPAANPSSSSKIDDHYTVWHPQTKKKLDQLTEMKAPPIDLDSVVAEATEQHAKFRRQRQITTMLSPNSGHRQLTTVRGAHQQQHQRFNSLLSLRGLIFFLSLLVSTFRPSMMPNFLCCAKKSQHF